jgi:hypothetical protein
VHGWLSDPASDEYKVVGKMKYNELVEMAFGSVQKDPQTSVDIQQSSSSSSFFSSSSSSVSFNSLASTSSTTPSSSSAIVHETSVTSSSASSSSSSSSSSHFDTSKYFNRNGSLIAFPSMNCSDDEITELMNNMHGVISNSADSDKQIPLGLPDEKNDSIYIDNGGMGNGGSGSRCNFDEIDAKSQKRTRNLSVSLTSHIGKVFMWHSNLLLTFDACMCIDCIYFPFHCVHYNFYELFHDWIVSFFTYRM